MLNKLVYSLAFIVFITVLIFFIQNKKDIVVVKEKNIIKIKSCKLEEKECVVESNEFKVKISFEDHIYYLKPFNVFVMNENTDNIKFESVQVDFKMNNMNMGVNRFKLKNTGLEKNKQVWQGKALLPICVTGRADWLSEFEIETTKNKYLISLPILVKKSAN